MWGLAREPSPPFYTVPQNGGDDVCAREGGANTYRFCASPFLKEFYMARLHFDELVLPPSKAQSLELPQNAERKRLGRREGGEMNNSKEPQMI